MDEDQDFCRVCRSESTPDHPLYHPCKCSGSIRFVHEDCLIKWLSHSKKKYCELCKHPFAFSPIYRDDMPARVPVSILFSKFIQHSVALSKVVIRGSLVIFVWLMLVPNIILYSWRFFFWSGENIGIKANTTEPIVRDDATMEAIETSSSPLLTYLHTFLSNSIEGLVIMAFVIVNLIAVYLFRDWITQNMPAEPEIVVNNNNQGEVEQRALDTILNVMQALNQEDRDRAEIQQLRRRMEDLRVELDGAWADRGGLRDLDHEEEEEADFFDNEQGDDDHLQHRHDHENDDVYNHVFGRHLFDENPVEHLQFNADFPADNDDFGQARPMEREWVEMAPPVIQPAVIERNERLVQRREPPAPRQRQVNANAPADADAPMDVDDELVGLLEAAGFRGNPWMMVQNSTLLSVVMFICLGVAVWVPYIIGRCFILIRPTTFIQTPIYLMRLVTDPLVDFVLDLCLPFVWSNIKFMVPEQIQAFFDKQPPMSVTPVTVAEHGHLDWIQSKLESMASVVLERWNGFAMGDRGIDRAVCIFVGYLVLVGIGSWILSYRTRRGSTMDTIRSKILRRGLLLKVMFFIVVELAIFPAVCGFLLDVSTLPLFANASLATRYEFNAESPYTSYIIHWVLGTSVLFYYANFIATCRSIIRPGVMWFIRDPNDPQFHPIQEMVERPFGNMLHKISQSALIYASVLVAGVGSVTYALGWTGVVFPLDLTWDAWIIKDLLVALLLLPPLWTAADPNTNAKKLFAWWWRWASRQLRLTFFMFNERRPEEEGRHVARTWKAFFSGEKAEVPEDDVGLEDEHASVVFKRDGMMVRVPKYDSVPVDPKRRMIVPVDPVTHEAIDEEERSREHPAAAHTRDESQSTIVVYLPPFYKLRFFVFLFYMWFFISLCTCSITVLPMLMGRVIFKYGVGVQLNDIYCLTLGLYLMIGIGLSMFWVRKYNAFANQIEAKEYKKEKTTMVFKYLYLMSIIGAVIPILLGITIDLYILKPLYDVEQESTLLVYVVQSWSYGAACIGGLSLAVHYLPANNRLKVKLQEMIGQDVMQMDLLVVTRKMIVPVIASALLAITLPKLISWGILYFIDDMITTRYVYPIVFGVALFMLFMVALKKLFTVWIEKVRDDTYLIGQKLHNMQTP